MNTVFFCCTLCSKFKWFTSLFMRIYGKYLKVDMEKAGTIVQYKKSSSCIQKLKLWKYSIRMYSVIISNYSE